MTKNMIPDIRFKGFTEYWEQRKLGDILEFLKGKELSLDSFYEGKDKPSIAYGHLYTIYSEVITEINLSSNQKGVLSKKGDLLFPGSSTVPNGTAQSSALLLDNIYLGGDVIIGRPKINNLDSTFLSYQINSDKRRMYPITVGTTITHMYGKDLAKLNYNLAEFEEQKSISKLFMSIDYTITLHQRKLESLEKMKKSMLQKMFPKSGQVIPELRFAGFTEDWEQRKLEDLVERHDNLRIPITASERTKGEIPYYGANGIQDFVDGFTHEGEFVLVAEDGANSLSDYPIRFVSGKVWVNNHAHVVSSIAGKSTNLFTMYSLKNVNIEPYLVGGGRAKLNSETMMKLPISITCLEEQTKIGEFFKIIDDTITLHQQKLDKIKEIKKSFLQKMFI